MNSQLNIIEIEFKGMRRGVFSNPMEFPFKVGDWAVVEVERGMDLGIVSHIGQRPCVEEMEPLEFSIVRKASPEDLQRFQENRDKEKDALKVCLSMVKDHKLEMKLVDAEFQFDGRKITFYFTADGRVDFRELVKDLAGHFRTRIDLRQIGARDETRKLSGYGICGLELCCTTWITEFLPITTQMPKEQNLSLNPQKLSGVCGRLKCCLRYELDFYREVMAKFPPTETKIEGYQREEIGIIEKIDVFRRAITIRYSDEETEDLAYDIFKREYRFQPEHPVPEVITRRHQRPEQKENTGS
jgi:cell fate regulator YaaT (PSP1 superfamily)